MSQQDSSESSTQSALAEEQARKREEFLREYPGGSAPFTRNNLIVFGFWSGIVGAGIAGAVNLKRTNQSQRIPLLLLITLGLFLLFWLATIAVTDRITLSSQQVDANTITISQALVNIVLGMVFAGLIGLRQRAALRRWRDLAGNPVLNWQAQGGCGGAIGLVVFSVVVGIVLLTIWNALFLNPALQVIYPPQRYSVKGISVSAPGGWGQTAPEKAGTSCTLPGLTCLAVVSERSSGTIAAFLLAQGVSPLVMINAVAAGISRSNPSSPSLTAQPYTHPALANRTAYTFDLPLNGRSVVITTIGDGTVVIIFTLNCADKPLPFCKLLRDQFVSSLAYSAPPGTPDLHSFR